MTARNYLNISVIFIPVLCAAVAVATGQYLPHAAVPITCIPVIIFLRRRDVRHTWWLLIAALLLSIAGDWMLRHRGSDGLRFICGIALFFGAHVGYLLFCLRNGQIKWLWLTVLLACYGLFFMIALGPAIQETAMRVAVLLYMLISCFSLAAASGLQQPVAVRWLFMAGIACIIFSDTLIALHEFMHTARWLYATLMMPTYYASHILITTSAVYPQSEEPACL
ncbi:MAG: lysoplasmalogenase [Bacteroidales bacterium]|jgi:uncharacterized membrane protein YhhN|nr:lysoplasmalogenase [Bacteroidales bacterium]